ncbi:MAG: hypothetical protein LBN71_06295 [Tannerella sp.]|jgi:hypothetical protein|nr:hypothetical protein [Tannerella sp.]
MNVRFIKTAIVFFVLLAAGCSCKPVVRSVDKFANVNHPQILYWFWDDATITDRQYLKDIDKMATQSPFDLVMLTSRFTDSTGFWNTERLKPYLAEAVAHAHQKGIKVVLQLWPMNRTRELFIRDFPVETADAEALIAEGECTLDTQGKGFIQNKPAAARFNAIIHAQLVKGWLFKQTSEGFYDLSTLKEIEREWITEKINNDFSVDVSVSAPAAYSGYTAYIVTAHYYNYFDVLSDKHFGVFRKMLDDYADIPFDGAALDENGNMGIKNTGAVMTERTWSDDFAVYYRNKYQSEPDKLLLDMRYAPDNKPEIRIKAINTYFEERTKGPIAVEDSFYYHIKKLFGKDCFIGCHSTFHNALTGDDVWNTGVDWWDLPREYGQTDEGFPMQDRMGVGISGSQPVMYNMFYSKSKESLLKEAMDRAAYGVREHYHAWNDIQGWGKNIGDDDFLADLEPVESRIRLLNQFNPAAPKLPILIVYNFPYLFNWYPDTNQRNNMGIRNTDMQSAASSVWAAGYPCASVPSTWLDRNMVTVREDGKVQIKDRVFDAVIFLYPQYAKPSSLAFMKEVLDKNGRLMIKGEATRDFDGNDCSSFFADLSHRAVPFEKENFSLLAPANTVSNGIFLQDGSVVMSDYASVKNKSNTVFNIKVGENEFTGSYKGIFALKTDSKGKIEKMACGNFMALQRNGVTILEIKTPADLLITKEKGKTVITWKGKENEILINLN